MGRWDLCVDKKVNFGEIAGDWRQDVTLVYLLENELDLGFSSWCGLLLHESNEEVDGVRVDAHPFVLFGR